MWRGEEIDRAIIENAPAVRRMANSMSRRLPPNVDRQDLFQAGMIGLLEAATRFDPDAGWLFLDYARDRIRGAMLDELRALDWAPRNYRREFPDALMSHEVPEQADTSGNPLDILIGQNTAKGILARFLELPAKQRIVLIRHYDDEVSLKDISVELGVTASRVCQILKEGIKALHDAV